MSQRMSRALQTCQIATKGRSMAIPIRRFRRNPRRFYSSPPPNTTLSQRFKKLSREYGWSAFGVYMLLSALDFPFCFLAVRSLGVERIGHAEKVVVGYLGEILPDVVKDTYIQASGSIKGIVKSPLVDKTGVATISPTFGTPKSDDDHGVLQAQRDNKGDNASIWTQLALAYAIHKSFIFLRIPLTVAVTPKVVKTLRGWGWNIGKAKVDRI